MKIVNEYPPNYLLIKNALNLKDHKPLFSYGGVIYNPHERNVTPDLEIHEQVHAVQQGTDPDKWWDKYLLDPVFRLEQEVEAYGTQYVFFKQHAKNGRLTQWLKGKMAEALSSSLYGNIITHNAAESRINKFAKSAALK